jgi:hypothetical protein
MQTADPQELLAKELRAKQIQEQIAAQVYILIITLRLVM